VTTDATTGSYLIGIFYLEAVAGPVFQCGPSRSTAPPSSAQQQLLGQFEEHCMDAFDAYPRRVREVPDFRGCMGSTTPPSRPAHPNRGDDDGGRVTGDEISR